MANFVSNGRDRNGLAISWKGASPYKGAYVQSKLENGRRIFWAYVSLKDGEHEKVNKAGWAYFLYASEDPRACAYVSEKFAKNRAANMKALETMVHPKRYGDKCWGDQIAIPNFVHEAITTEEVNKAREERKAIRDNKAKAKTDRPFRKARRGIGSY